MSAQGLHLLLTEIGNGAYCKNENGVKKDLKKASFLPVDSTITVRSDSGIETLAAGFQFRFGFETQFSLNRNYIDLKKGSILIQSRKLTNKVFIRHEDNEITISGVGTCMFEVRENRSITMVGILGRMLVGMKNDVVYSDLLAGDLIELGHSKQEFSDKKNVDLAKIVKTSFLISGFPNNASFKNSVDSMVQAQIQSIDQSNLNQKSNTKPASEDLRSQNTKVDSSVESSGEYKISSSHKITSYDVPDVDPLNELLGRNPIRSGPGLIKAEPKKSILNRLPGNLFRSAK
jgi:hypothetical protein